MKKTVEKILRIFVLWYLKKRNPEIIAITGSVGKTTTKKAVLILISSKFKTNTFSETGYNTEIGVPLFILGQRAPRAPFLWPVTILKCFFISLFSQKKLKKLVVEMGADKPGDISYLLSFIKPKVSIVTAVAPAHLEAFKSIDHILEEKGKIVETLPKNGLAALNYDDIRVRSLSQKTKAKVLTYGLLPEADIYASNIKTSVSGTRFKLHFKNQETAMHIKSIGEHSVYSVLAAACCGVYYRYSLEEIKTILGDFTPMPGRMSLLTGIRGSILIDDSYNSNPTSLVKALETLKKIAPQRKIAVLGTMNELGDYFLEAHKQAGSKVVGIADILVTVGDGGKIIAEEAQKKGMASTNSL